MIYNNNKIYKNNIYIQGRISSLSGTTAVLYASDSGSISLVKFLTLGTR